MAMRKVEKSHQNDFEKLRNSQRLVGFDEKSSVAYSFLHDRFWPKPSRHELLSLAQVVSEHLHILLDREAFRRKRVLFKWYDENWGMVEPFIRQNIVILDKTGAAIGGDPRAGIKA
jgi:hypothetical protein